MIITLSKDEMTEILGKAVDKKLHGTQFSYQESWFVITDEDGIEITVGDVKFNVDVGFMYD
jgi:hypothetical protein